MRYEKRRASRIWFRLIGALAAGLVLFIGFVYAYDMPGGIADWRYSRAAGYPATIKIPLGDTPEQAVMKFRDIPANQVIHQEAVDGGVLLFTKRSDRKDGTDLGIEFVRKTWLGWKWVYGGGYGLSALTGQKEAINYMSIPRYKGIDGPFPIIYGQITDRSITGIQAAVGGDGGGEYNAKIINEGVEQRIWYVLFPGASNAPYKIEAFNGEGTVVASKTLNDPADSGTVLMSTK